MLILREVNFSIRNKKRANKPKTTRSQSHQSKAKTMPTITKKKAPLITIGITCFNAQDTIERCIISACQQDWSAFEIIIVDDCSTDNSKDTIKALCQEDERIRLIEHKTNKGYPSALNTIVKNAQGEYIAFFDDDDDNKNHRLTEQYKRLYRFETDHPSALAVCYSHRRVFVDGQEKPEAFVKAIGSTKPEPHGPMVADYLLWHRKEKGYSWGEFGSCTMMAPTKLLKEFRFNPEFRRCAEWDLAVRLAFKGAYFISVDEALITQHKTQTQDKAGTKPLHYGLLLRKKHKEYLKKHRLYCGAILQAYARFYYFRNNRWKSRLYLALACLCAPHKIMREEFRKRLTKNTTTKNT